MSIRLLLLTVSFAVSASVTFAIEANSFSSNAGFVENRGQFHDQFFKTSNTLLFVAEAGDIQIQLRTTGFSYQIASNVKADNNKDPRTESMGDVSINRIDFDFPSNVSPSDIVKSNQLPQTYNFVSTENYYGISAYRTITYRNVFPNIDIQFDINSKSDFKYSYILHEGSDVNLINLDINSDLKPTIKENKLLFDFGNFRLEETIPASWIESTPGVKIEDLDVSYRLGDNTQTPELSLHYKGNPKTSNIAARVIIDPTPTVIWGTYYGGPAIELAGEMSVSPTAVYLAGQTPSTSLIATSGAFQTTIGGSYDAFLAKFSSAGVMLWATYFGGVGDDRGWGVDQDSYGNVYLGGITESNGLATAGAYQTSMSGASDAFFVKFNSSGVRQWSTYYGGPTSQDRIWSLHVDLAQDIYIAGDTKSWSGIATAGSHQSSMGGDDDAFLAKFSSSGSRIWATYYGGAGGEEGASITTHNTDVFMTGTYTSSSNNIATAGSHQPTRSGQYDTYLVKFNGAGVRQWGTYYGGTTNYDEGTSVAVDCNGSAWLAGNTTSTTGIATAGSHQSTYGGGSSDGFVACFNSAGVRLYGSYYGGSSSDGISGVVRAGADLLYFVGSTNSSSGIATAGSLNPSFLGGNDGFIARFTVGGVRMWGTYYGGSGSDACTNIGIISGDMFVTGTSTSNSGIATSGAYQTYMAGGSDCFITKFDGPSASVCINKDPKFNEGDTLNSLKFDVNNDNNSKQSILQYNQISNKLTFASNSVPETSILSIHDISGRLLFNKVIGSTTEFDLPAFLKNSQLLVVRIITPQNSFILKIVP